ncbi:glycosyltransferase involved in cell wall biosynthesis [Conyzicola lurida]|uniref:Glycosyltransferase involved in cell wall biosynthesis n=1 Tax=Conyzicola lurida TaxID=1172621 RepID=A0A841ATL1_9MICO|nr:glycosyltransferase involved in cell wall biosynthesis [Conyzicola lurida]
MSGLIDGLRTRGVRDTAQRVVARLHRRLDVAELDFPLLPGDVADSLRLGPPPARMPVAGPVRVGWICTPPSPGSGGHTTLFRMVAELERQGHECVLFLYDRHGGDLARHERVVRENWPKLRARVVDAAADAHSFNTVDALVATGWQTAHVLARRAGSSTARRLYFVQDFEPFFYPRGSLYALAEDSYRFGFRTISLGRMVYEHLRIDIGIDTDLVGFGCDTDVYRLTNRGPRSGVVFYEKPGNDRRGYTLARLALEEFHAQHPTVPIHLYGDGGPAWPFPVVRHGRLSPVALSELYNQVITGIAMSFTNISLVAEEMLAAGVIPVVNDTPSARADLSHPDVAWAAPTPGGIADALGRAVTAADVPDRAHTASLLVRQGWRDTASRVADIVLDEVRATPTAATEVAS